MTIARFRMAVREAGGAPLRRVALVPAALALYIGVTVIHGGLRAASDNLSPFAPIDISALDSAAFGGMPSVWLQDVLGRNRLFASASFMLWQSLFYIPPMLTLAVAMFYGWRMFLRLLLLYAILLLSADVLYTMLPTRPPWMDADATRLVAQEFAAVELDRNPYAAIPSLHVGLPALYALWFARMPRRTWCISSALWMWTIAMGGAVVHLGEHYVIDVVAGIAWAGLVYFAMERAQLTHVQRAAEPVALRRQTPVLKSTSKAA
jgi:hypothetical protein